MRDQPCGRSRYIFLRYGDFERGAGDDPDADDRSAAALQMEAQKLKAARKAGKVEGLFERGKRRPLLG